MTAAVGTIFPLMCPEDGRISLLRKADHGKKHTFYFVIYGYVFFGFTGRLGPYAAVSFGV